MSRQYPAVSKLIDKIVTERIVSRIWNRDVSVWGAAPGSADATSIESRLGWLEIGRSMPPAMTRVSELATRVVDRKIDAVYLLGMGGSSLCAEVMRSVLGIGEAYPDIYVLDTTDERAITGAAAQLDPTRALFLVSSKSGGTVEVASLERFFWARMTHALGDEARRHFVAITDPGTVLQRLAESKRYLEVFVNPADIGGRFSALSLFGLVPCALIGADPHEMLTAGTTMAEGCRQEHHTNPGLELGAFIGAAALDGRDKLTVVLPASLATLGLWIEQLIAESTGKHGKGALPVVDEPLGRPDDYHDDRAFVAIATERDEPDPQRLAALEDAGHPVLRLRTRIDALGAEFFRWEFATAVAGAALGINPFDEPNVAEAKDKTRALLSAYAAGGQLPEPTPLGTTANGITAYSPSFSGASPVGVVKAAIDSLAPHDYVAVLSYLPATHDVDTRVGEIRQGIRRRRKVATTFGVGPRYLHSTGQYHKGGPPTIVAFVLTADDETQTAIPDADYSFSILKRAQALGDTDTLAAHNRRVVRLHARASPSSAIEAIEAVFAEALR